MILAIVCFVLAGLCAVISAMSFMEKGFLFNNAYIWASPEEREVLDKKPYYRQTAIVFCLICLALVVIGVSVILENYMLELLEIPLIAGAVIYAVVSSGRISKRMKA